MNPPNSHRLEGLEPDNLLAFIALLGLLRALEADDREQPAATRLTPRAAWDIDHPPLRPRLVCRRPVSCDEVTERAAHGIELLATAHDFGGAQNLNFTVAEARPLLRDVAENSNAQDRERADLFAALMTDAAVKDEKTLQIAPTPLCLQFGQGHQHFLARLASVPAQEAPPPVGRGRSRVEISGSACLAQALFEPWHRNDPTFSFRWDPEEDVRYALMAGDPTDSAYKTGTQHGANRLAAIGLAALTVVPVRRYGRVRIAVIGGDYSEGFSFAWPIWREPASLRAIRAMLAHPDLRTPDGLLHLGVEHVYAARRINVGKFMNFSRGRALQQGPGAVAM